MCRLTLKCSTGRAGDELRRLDVVAAPGHDPTMDAVARALATEYGAVPTKLTYLDADNDRVLLSSEAALAAALAGARAAVGAPPNADVVLQLVVWLPPAALAAAGEDEPWAWSAAAAEASALAARAGTGPSSDATQTLVASVAGGSEAGDGASAAGPLREAALGPPFRWTMCKELLGSGSYGSVYLGLTDGGQIIAVKEVRHVADDARGRTRVEALRREVNIMRRLRHPNIVRYLGAEVSTHTSTIHILMEFVSAGSIKSLLRKFGRLNEALVRNFTLQILQGLEYLHSHSILHRDIKGANILVDADGVVKLADFGASKLLEDVDGDGARSLKGTPYWMAPEVLTQAGAFTSADIWSVGCTVIEMIQGTPPWSHIKQKALVYQRISSGAERPPHPSGISADCRAFLDACFALDQAARPTAVEAQRLPFVADVSVPAPSTHTTPHVAASGDVVWVPDAVDGSDSTDSDALGAAGLTLSMHDDGDVCASDPAATLPQSPTSTTISSSPSSLAAAAPAALTAYNDDLSLLSTASTSAGELGAPHTHRRSDSAPTPPLDTALQPSRSSGRSDSVPSPLLRGLTGLLDPVRQYFWGSEEGGAPSSPRPEGIVRTVSEPLRLCARLGEVSGSGDEVSTGSGAATEAAAVHSYLQQSVREKVAMVKRVWIDVYDAIQTEFRPRSGDSPSSASGRVFTPTRAAASISETATPASSGTATPVDDVYSSHIYDGYEELHSIGVYADELASKYAVEGTAWGGGRSGSSDGMEEVVADDVVEFEGSFACVSPALATSVPELAEPRAEFTAVFDIKPLTPQTNVAELEAAVRLIDMERLQWGLSSFEPVAFGVLKLRIVATFMNEYVALGDVEDAILAFSDLVQSVEVIAVNRLP